MSKLFVCLHSTAQIATSYGALAGFRGASDLHAVPPGPSSNARHRAKRRTCIQCRGQEIRDGSACNDETAGGYATVAYASASGSAASAGTRTSGSSEQPQENVGSAEKTGDDDENDVMCMCCAEGAAPGKPLFERRYAGEPVPQSPKAAVGQFLSQSWPLGRQNGGLRPEIERANAEDVLTVSTWSQQQEREAGSAARRQSYTHSAAASTAETLGPWVGWSWSELFSARPQAEQTSSVLGWNDFSGLPRSRTDFLSDRGPIPIPEDGYPVVLPPPSPAASAAMRAATESRGNANETNDGAGVDIAIGVGSESSLETPRRGPGDRILPPAPARPATAIGTPTSRSHAAPSGHGARPQSRVEPSNRRRFDVFAQDWWRRMVGGSDDTIVDGEGAGTGDRDEIARPRAADFHRHLAGFSAPIIGHRHFTWLSTGRHFTWLSTGLPSSSSSTAQDINVVGNNSTSVNMQQPPQSGAGEVRELVQEVEEAPAGPGPRQDPVEIVMLASDAEAREHGLLPGPASPGSTGGVLSSPTSTGEWDRTNRNSSSIISHLSPTSSAGAPRHNRPGGDSSSSSSSSGGDLEFYRDVVALEFAQKPEQRARARSAAILRPLVSHPPPAAGPAASILVRVGIEEDEDADAHRNITKIGEAVRIVGSCREWEDTCSRLRAYAARASVEEQRACLRVLTELSCILSRISFAEMQAASTDNLARLLHLATELLEVAHFVDQELLLVEDERRTRPGAAGAASSSSPSPPGGSSPTTRSRSEPYPAPPGSCAAAAMLRDHMGEALGRDESPSYLRRSSSAPIVGPLPGLLSEVHAQIESCRRVEDATGDRESLAPEDHKGSSSEQLLSQMDDPLFRSSSCATTATSGLGRQQGPTDHGEEDEDVTPARCSSYGVASASSSGAQNQDHPTQDLRDPFHLRNDEACVLIGVPEPGRPRSDAPEGEVGQLGVAEESAPGVGEDLQVEAEDEEDEPPLYPRARTVALRGDESVQIRSILQADESYPARRSRDHDGPEGQETPPRLPAFFEDHEDEDEIFDSAAFSMANRQRNNYTGTVVTDYRPHTGACWVGLLTLLNSIHLRVRRVIAADRSRRSSAAAPPVAVVVHGSNQHAGRSTPAEDHSIGDTPAPATRGRCEPPDEVEGFKSPLQKTYAKASIRPRSNSKEDHCRRSKVPAPPPSHPAFCVARNPKCKLVIHPHCFRQYCQTTRRRRTISIRSDFYVKLCEKTTLGALLECVPPPLSLYQVQCAGCCEWGPYERVHGANLPEVEIRDRVRGCFSDAFGCVSDAFGRWAERVCHIHWSVRRRRREERGAHNQGEAQGLSRMQQVRSFLSSGRRGAVTPPPRRRTPPSTPPSPPRTPSSPDSLYLRSLLDNTSQGYGPGPTVATPGGVARIDRRNARQANASTVSSSTPFYFADVADAGFSPPFAGVDLMTRRPIDVFGDMEWPNRGERAAENRGFLPGLSSPPDLQSEASRSPTAAGSEQRNAAHVEAVPSSQAEFEDRYAGHHLVWRNYGRPPSLSFVLQQETHRRDSGRRNPSRFTSADAFLSVQQPAATGTNT